MTPETGPGAPAFRFVEAEACNMCGAPPARFRLLGRRNSGHQGLRAGRSRGVTVPIWRCGDCGLVFPDPMPLPRSLDDLYGVDPSAYWGPEYFQVADDYLAGQCAIARQLLGDDTTLRALDIGAGVGKGVVALRKHGFDARGLEPSPTFRAFALERMGLADDDVVLGSVEEATFAPGSFDFVNFGAVLEHLPDPRGSLARALTWVAPGGVVHVEVPSADWLLARGLNLFYRLTHQGFVTNTSPMHPPYHLYEFTERSFARAVAGLGWRVERTDIWVGDVYAPAPVRPALRALMAGTGTGMQLAVWLRKT